MNEYRTDAEKPLHDRALLLHGPKRNKVLTLEEVRQYGSDSFSDPDYIQLYGMISKVEPGGKSTIFGSVRPQRGQIEGQ
jgi:hypothetical protein